MKPKAQKNTFSLKNTSPIANIQDDLVENSSVSESGGGGEKGEREEVTPGKGTSSTLGINWRH